MTRDEVVRVDLQEVARLTDLRTAHEPLEGDEAIAVATTAEHEAQWLLGQRQPEDRSEIAEERER